MRYFRIIRKGPGITVQADGVKEALKKEQASMDEIFSDPGPFNVFSGLQPDPVSKVYELVEIPEEEWK